jgi:hopanoid biosynthesis associated radical SAM protein HpnH
VQDKFLKRKQTRELFRKVLAPAKQKKWVFNHSPFYLDFLKGDRDYECTPWGNPNYTIFGWQRPCYLMNEGGYARTFKELMEDTDWSKYGVASGNRKCRDCMVHAGYEPSAVNDSMSNPRNVLRSIAAAIR